MLYDFKCQHVVIFSINRCNIKIAEGILNFDVEFFFNKVIDRVALAAIKYVAMKLAYETQGKIVPASVVCAFWRIGISKKWAFR